MSWNEFSDPVARLDEGTEAAVFVGVEPAGAGEADDKRDADEAVALRKMAYEANYDREKTIHDARVEVIKAALDRAQAGAEYLRNVATGILAIYQAVLGFDYVAKDHPIQLSALVGTTFLALAIASAAAYVAWLGEAPDVPGARPAASLKVFQERQLNAFARWIQVAVLDRVVWMHFAVVCLFLGAIALPLPFITINGVDQNDPRVFLAMLAVGLVVAIGLTIVTQRRHDPDTGGSTSRQPGDAEAGPMTRRGPTI